MIYLDNSATSRYKPDCVIAAVNDALANSANPGRSGHSAALDAAACVLDARERLNRLCGNDGHCVLTAGCTHALNLAILGTARCGHVITTATEHNSVLRPLQALARAGRIRLTVLAPDAHGRITLSALRAALRHDTYLVAVNLVSNVTGTAQSVGEIGAFCRSRGILLLADGAQAAGYVPINMHASCIDMLALAPHKGLHAPMGAGALLLSERARPEPVLYGGTGTDSFNAGTDVVLPEGLEAGTLPQPAIAGLAAAAEWVSDKVSSHGAHNLALTARLGEELRRLGAAVYSDPNASGVVAFCFAGRTSADVADACDRAGLYVRGGYHCAPLMHEYLGTLSTGAVRVSVSCDTTDADIDDALDILREVKTSRHE